MNKLGFIDFKSDQLANKIWEILNKIKKDIQNNIERRNTDGLVYFSEFGKKY